jgi:hypothetical protein
MLQPLPHLCTLIDNTTPDMTIRDLPKTLELN